MKTLYQRTFDQVQLSDQKKDAIRTVLNSDSFAQTTNLHMEERNMKRSKMFHRPVSIVLALFLVFGFGGTAFAYGTGWIAHVYQMVTGGTITQGVDENGAAYSAVTIGAEGTPIEQREDGRCYLIVNGENMDITDLCSYTVPYIYEYTDHQNVRHAIVIGGNPDAIGWAEYLWDEDGLPAGGAASFGTSAGREDAPWLDAALERLGLPW